MNYWVLRLASQIAQRLPERVCYSVAILLSNLAWLLMRAKREAALENMTRVLGRADRRDPVVRKKVREAFRYYGLYLADFLRLPSMNPEKMDRKFKFSGWDQIDKALEAGKGVIFISAHVGNWDLGAAAFARRYPLSVVAETFHPKKVNDLVQGHREHVGMKVIPLENAARKVLGALRKNEILGLLIDRPSPEAGVGVRFFGRDTEVPAGAALLALKTGARLISGITVRNPDHTFSAFVTSHLDVDLTGELATDIGILTQRIMDNLESLIRQYPEQWFIFRQMWPEDASADACS